VAAVEATDWVMRDVAIGCGAVRSCAETEGCDLLNSE
jgi:hypothetical protein